MPADLISDEDDKQQQLQLNDNSSSTDIDNCATADNGDQNYRGASTDHLRTANQLRRRATPNQRRSNCKLGLHTKQTMTNSAEMNRDHKIAKRSKKNKEKKHFNDCKSHSTSEESSNDSFQSKNSFCYNSSSSASLNKEYDVAAAAAQYSMFKEIRNLLQDYQDGWAQIEQPTTLLINNKRQQTAPIVKNVEFTLEECLNGCVKNVTVSRQRFTCNENGQLMRYNTEEKMLTVLIAPGCERGTRFVFKQEGDRYPYRIPNDVIVVANDQPHATFERSGTDLIYQAPIELRQALSGHLTLKVPTLDGSSICIEIKEIINPKTIKRVEDLGLPFAKAPAKRGQLIIQFDISFPAQLSTDQQDALSKL